jgi:hypothetical protein
MQEITNYEEKLHDESDAKSVATMADHFASDPKAGGQVGTHAMFSADATELSPKAAMDGVEFFRAKIDEVSSEPEVRDNGANSISVMSMDYHRKGMIEESIRMQEANLAYSMFSGTSDMAARSVVRVRTMQEEMPEVATEDTDFDALLKPHEKTMEDSSSKKGSAATSGVDKTIGLVRGARDNFQTARESVQDKARGFSTVLMGQIMSDLTAKVNTKKEEKDAIMARIARIKKGVTVLTTGISLLSKGASMGAGFLPGLVDTDDLFGAHPMKGQTEGVMGNLSTGAGLVGALVDGLVELKWGDDLKIIELQMTSLQGEISEWAGHKEKELVAQRIGEFQTAKADYMKKAEAYRDAIANQRTAYATLGADTDRAEAGAKMKGVKDPTQKVMIYLSAVREAKLMMEDANRAWTDGDKGAKGAMKKASDAMMAHTGDYEGAGKPGYRWRQGKKGWQTADVTFWTRPDNKALLQAEREGKEFEKNYPKQQEQLQKLDAGAQKAMSNRAGVAGDY